MPEVVLSSRSHPLLKVGRALHGAKGRREHALFLLEGLNAVRAAVLHSWPLRELFVLDSEDELDGAVAALPARRATREFLAQMCDSTSPPPVVAWGELPAPVSAPRFADGLTVVLDGIADPGNVGTIWRAAHALGAAQIVTARGTADVWNPKVVRSAAGSLFALPPLSLEDDSPANIARLLREQNIAIVRADAHGQTSLEAFKWPRRAALILGHETRGVSAEFAGQSVIIPLPGSAESLNVAMAATIFLWEWKRFECGVRSAERGIGLVGS